MNYELVIRKPDKAYVDELLDMAQEYISAKEPFYNYRAKQEAYKKIETDLFFEYGNIPEGMIPSFCYWFFYDDKIIGTSRLRPKLNEKFITKGGNIGYDVRPKYRMKGFGSTILRMTLNKAKEMGLSEVLITCDDNNIGSIRVIQNNKGRLINQIYDENNVLINRYIVDT